jgi:hypothetical protein
VVEYDDSPPSSIKQSIYNSNIMFPVTSYTTRISEYRFITNNSNLKIVSYVTEEVKDSIYNVAPLVPIAVHLNSDKKVVVGARDSGEYYHNLQGIALYFHIL